MLKNRLKFYAKILSLIFFAVACNKKIDAPSIGNNVSYPGSIVALNSSRFLMLNTSANGDYTDGSIQQYLVDSSGNYILQNSISVPTHGSEIAVSPDSNLVALSFDNSFSKTQVQFYNYSNSSSPLAISNITLTLFSAGGKQSIKRLRFFTPPTGGGNYYYLYGSIYSYPQDDGSSGYVPNRVFVAKISKDFSTASVMFTLSYGIGDPNSLAQKSNSLVTYPYSFGSSAPSFDEAHNLLIAFPTGSIGGLQDSNITYPPNPERYSYFSGQTNANVANCGLVAVCSQPDMRVNSLFVVDFAAILNGDLLNNSVYFAPLAWNANGIPYGARSNNVLLNYAAYTAAGGTSNSDLTSLSFQNNFWSSFWVNAPNLGNGGSSCYSSPTATQASTEYSLNLLGQNALLVGKYGANGGGDVGFGNEVLQIAGLDILKSSIATIKQSRISSNIAGETDFNAIASVQILDPFNTYYSAIKVNWLNEASSPIVPYMYSRTTGVSGFDGTQSAPINFSTLNFGSNSCQPYWVRDTNVGFARVGLDSAWLSANSVPITAGTNQTYYNATLDPVQSYRFSFPYADGAQICTDVSPVANSPKIICANFLRGTLTRFNATSSGAIFTQY